VVLYQIDAFLASTQDQAGQPVFDDSGQYWFEDQPTAGVKVPKAGVRIKVISRDGTSMRIKVQPSPPH